MDLRAAAPGLGRIAETVWSGQAPSSGFVLSLSSTVFIQRPFETKGLTRCEHCEFCAILALFWLCFCHVVLIQQHLLALFWHFFKGGGGGGQSRVPSSLPVHIPRATCSRQACPREGGKRDSDSPSHSAGRQETRLRSPRHRYSPRKRDPSGAVIPP